MEMGSIGFLLGALTAIIFIGIGVIIGDGRHIKAERDIDSDINIYVPMRYRDRGGNKRNYQPTTKEIGEVLYSVRIGASPHEKEIIDYLIDNLCDGGEYEEG